MTRRYQLAVGTLLLGGLAFGSSGHAASDGSATQQEQGQETALRRAQGGGGVGAPGGPGPVSPTPGALQPVHHFFYDAQAETYVLPRGRRVSQDDVERDLAGSLCSRCHRKALGEVKDSVHFKSAGRTTRVLFPGGGAHGMLDRACGLPSTTGLTNYLSDVNLGECAKCHVGRYMPVMEPFFASMFSQMGIPDPAGQATRLVDAGVDCLICHAEEYRSVPDGLLAEVAGHAPADGHSPTPTGFARVARDNADFDHDGNLDLVLDMDGDGVMDAPLMYDSDGDGMPDTPWPTVAQDRGLAALSSIGPTSDETCLRCHEHARTGYKRGTLFVEGHDHHAGLEIGPFDGAENQCTVCHTASHHKFVRGHMVGGDLAAADYPPPPPGTPFNPSDPTDLACATCHDPADLSSGWAHSHTWTIACETCHIPAGSGITYSLFGQGGQVSFARNAAGKDTRLVVADMYVTENEVDRDADWEAYKTRPILTWFNGGTSFLAQSLAVRMSANAKITPFKPMANGMVFDARYFDGILATNDVGFQYNAHSMYRFYANGYNAEAIYALDMLDMTPPAVRSVTLDDLWNDDYNIATMALMQIFPNLVYFDKANFGYEHYLVRSGASQDGNGDGVIDSGQLADFDMFQAANAGLQQFMGFNGPMGFPPDYQWYPMFNDVSETISMKLPDGSLIKMFLQSKAADLPPDLRDDYLKSLEFYPSYSQITLGGHGVAPKEGALGALDCMDCHGANGLLANPVPVGQKQLVDMGGMQVELPLYAWKFYNVKQLIDLGLTVQSEEIVAGTADVDIDGDTQYVRESTTSFVLNWFMPNDPSGYRRPDDATSLQGTGLVADDLTWTGGDWMPVLEPVTDLVPNYAALGYERDEVIW